MIQQKHSFGKKNFKVVEEFIDRVEAKNLYRTRLSNNEKEYNVLVFYGVGGIGKSKLRNEICRMHELENSEGITFYLDLNSHDDRNLGNGILKLVDSCNNKKVDFKCFEMAYALYYRKKNPGAVYGREKEMVTDNPLVGIGLNFLGIFDSGVTAAAADLVEKSIRAISNRVIDADVKEELKHFDEYSLQEMEEMLPLFFQYDLKHYLDKHNDAKVLLIFDTFEALNENVLEKIHRSKNERWIQDIISYFDRKNFPNILITIFGRDEIEWEEWKDILVQKELKGFDDNYSREYLQKAGIEEPEIIEAIINCSKVNLSSKSNSDNNGYPFLLYLCLETYANIKNRKDGPGPRPEDFTGDYPQIIERFLYNLDKDTVEVLRLLSVPNFYTADLFSVLIREYNVSFPMTEFEQFNKYSFVTNSKNGGEFYIHDLMRKEMNSKTAETMLKSAHKTLLKYYSNKVVENYRTKYVLEMFYHAKEMLSVDEYNEWVNFPIVEGGEKTPLSIMKDLQKAGEQNVLYQILNGINRKYKQEQLLLDLINVMIDIVHLGGEYDRAVAMCEKYLDQYSESEVLEDTQLLKMRIRKIHHSMFYKPVKKLISEAEELIDKVNIERFHEQYNELLFLLGGNLGLLYGDYQYAENWLDMSMAYANKHELNDFKHRTIRKQADVFLANDKFNAAYSLVNGIVNMDMDLEEINTRYKIYLMGVLGEIYRKQNKLEEAFLCYEKLRLKAADQNIPGWEAHAYLALGLTMLMKSKFEESKNYIEKALAIYNRINQKWGIINSQEAFMLLNKKNGLGIKKHDIEDCKLLAEKMNYQYNIKIAEEIKNGEEPYLQLFFL